MKISEIFISGSVADMSVMTVTGAIIGPGTMHENKRM